MRIFEYVEPNWSLGGQEAFDHPRIIRMSEEDIMREYYPYWIEQMTKVNRADLINKENCIEDWMSIHWAMEVE